MVPSPLDKQTASCNLPHYWLMGLAMDLVALYDTVRGGEIGINGCYLAVQAHPPSPPPSITTYPLPSSTLHPYRSSYSIGYPN